MEYVPGSAWMRGPLGPPQPRPATEVWLHHSVTTSTPNGLADALVIERIGIARFGRLSYSDLIHGSDGKATQFGGQSGHIGAHTAGHNTAGHAFCSIGNFETDPCPDWFAQGIAAAIRRRMDEGVIARDAPIRPHSDVYSTACPGRSIRAQLPNIRRWVAEGVTPTGPDLSWIRDLAIRNNAEEDADMASIVLSVEKAPGPAGVFTYHEGGVSGVQLRTTTGAKRMRGSLLSRGLPSAEVPKAEWDAQVKACRESGGWVKV